MRPVTEAAGFTLAVLLYIWTLRFHWPSTFWLLVVAVLFSFYRHSENLASTGLDPRHFLAALKAWWVWFVVVGSCAAILAARNTISAGAIYNALPYLGWCIIQQVVYQTMVYRRLGTAFGHSWLARFFSGALFAVVHLPNPVLTPATFLWGSVSSSLFDQRPSTPALGLLQFFFSTALLYITPVEWHRNFRVGASYLHFKR